MAETPETDKPTPKRKIPIPFFFNLAANTNQGVASDRIGFRYKVVKVQAHFRDDAANNLQVWTFVSRNRNVSTAPPADNKILGFFAPTPYLVGEGEIVTVDCDVLPDESEQYLKVYFCNFNNYAMSGYCIITIESLEGLTDEELALYNYGADERTFSKEEWLAIGLAKGYAVTELTNDVMTGTSHVYASSIAKLKEQLGTTQEGLISRYQKASLFPTAIPPSMPIEDILKTVDVWARGIVDLTYEANTNNFLVKMVSGVLGGSSFDFVKYLEDIYGLQESVKKLYTVGVEKALIPHVEHYWNKFYVPQLPNASELINMVVKEKLPLSEFKVRMREHGFSDYWSQLIWDAHFLAPDFETVKRAYWRGFISKDELPDMMKRVDLDPEFNEKIWLALTEEIPPYADLINMRVKEVITQDTFEKGLNAWGFYGEWADRLWDAHFTPASFTDFLTAMRRQKAVSVPVAEGTPISHVFGKDAAKDIEIIKQLSVLADYDPRYWDFFATRIYNDPSYRMIMWGYESGAIPLERVPDLVHRLGLNPEDESWYVKFITSFQERAWINRYLTALMSAYVSDVISDTELTNRVTAIPRNAAIAEWMIKISDVRKEVLAKKPESKKTTLFTTSEWKKAYTYGLVSEDDFRTHLMQQGFELIEIDLMLNLMQKEKEMLDEGGKKFGLSVAELFNAYRYQEISEEELKTRLMQKGMNLDEINILVNSKKKAWSMGGVEGGD